MKIRMIILNYFDYSHCVFDTQMPFSADIPLPDTPNTNSRYKKVVLFVRLPGGVSFFFFKYLSVIFGQNRVFLI